jgi:16S rRNA (guanine527-N7)-methyltransferase
MFTADQLARLAEYQNMLSEWKRKFSLTSVPDEEMMARLILPSAWLGLEYSKVELGSIVDFGAGAGIPGLPMAIVDEVNKYLLIDSSEKKVGFIKACVLNTKLGIGNRAEARAERIGRGAWGRKVKVVTTRGTGSILDTVRLWTGKLADKGFIDIFKGERIDIEIRELMGKYPGAECEKIETPAWFGSLRLVRIKGVSL